MTPSLATPPTALPSPARHGKDRSYRIMGRKPFSSMSVEELIRRARAGDAAALEELLERSRARLVKRASRLAQSGAAPPSDVAQETALRAWRRFASFKGTTEAEWFAWVERILHRRAAQSGRDARRQKREAGRVGPLDSPEAAAAPSPAMSPSQIAAQQEDWRRLLTHVYELPDAQREALRLCHLEELPVEEAAQRMGRSKNSVAGLLQRARDTLRARMAEGGDADLLARLRQLRPTTSR